MSSEINIQPGKLPQFWDHSVIFFANLESLFFGNNSKLNQLKNEVAGVNTYGGRLLPIINILFKNKNNLLILEKTPCPSIQKYLSEDLGLELPQIEIFSHEIFNSVNTENDLNDDVKLFTEKISNHNASFVDGFVTDETLIKWAAKLGKETLNNANTCCKCNNKLELYYHIKETGLPVYDTEILSSNNDLKKCLKALNVKGYRNAVVKSQIGASGIGMLKLDTSDYKTEVPEYMFVEGPCLVQGWMEPGIKGIRDIYSPSVQIFIGRDSINLFDITEQILTKDSVHEGNTSPPPYLEYYPELRDELLRQASEVGKWLYDQNYKGTASVDFLVVSKNDSMEVFICEINARVTGATYPSVIARYFMPEGAWIMRNLKTESPIDGEQLLGIMNDAGALFYPEKNEGFLPINFNLDTKDRVIKGQFLFLGKNLTLCLNTLNQLREVLPVEWHYDRD